MPFKPSCLVTLARLAAALLLCSALVQLPAATAQSIYGPIANLTNGSNLTCSNKLTRLLGKAVTVSMANICDDFNMDRPSLVTCTGLDVLDDATKQVTGKCTPHKQAPVRSVSASGAPIAVPLPDRRPLPAGKFDHEAALLQQEGPTMYFYITNVINLFLWAPCKAHPGYKGPEWLVPDGWKLLQMVDTPPQGPYKAPLPMYAILKSADDKQLAVIIRGTRTSEEWAVDLTYLQTTDPAYPGMLSKGFLFGAGLLWPALEAALQKHVVEGGVSDVTVAGHSLGAAMATLLSYRAQVYLDDKLAAVNKPKVAVGALLYAPPNVGDSVFVQQYNKRVNARRIAFVYDFVPQVPCAPRMMACQNSIFPTATAGVTSWDYARVGGDITFGPADMPVQPEVWAKLNEMNACKMYPWALASHICSYPCVFSKYAGAAGDGRCQLWGDKKDRNGTNFCTGYPYESPEYPLKGNGAKVVVGTKPSYPNKHVELVIGGIGGLGR